MNKEINLCVLSSDRYKPYWPLFYGLFEHYESFKGFQVYHVSENQQFIHPQVTSIATKLPPKPQFWSENFAKVLECIDGEIFLLMLEDFFLTQPIEITKLMDHVHYMESNPEVGCIRLLPIPAGDKFWKDEEYKEHTSLADYKISTQAALWKKSFLSSIIRAGENPWQFEIEGSKRAVGSPWRVLVSDGGLPALFYFNAVIQGKLTKRGLKHCLECGLDLPLEGIKVNNSIEEFYWNTKQIWLRVLIDFIDKNLFKLKT